MALFATIVLGMSILGIVFLFLVKAWEEKRGRVWMPEVRLTLDARAVELKELLHRAERELGKLGPTSIRVVRTLLHELALSLAALSRASERQAHRLADLVSHKRTFRRRESTNKFLRQVSEFKNGKDDEGEPLI